MQAILLLLLSLFVFGCADSIEDSIEESPSFEEEFVSDEAPTLSGKADEITFAIEPLEFDVPQDMVGSQLRRTMTSEDAFQRVFGTESPGVDWENHWVIFYTTGPVDGIGNDASIETVLLAESGVSLQVITRHSQADLACQINVGPSRYEPTVMESPYTIVTIPRPAVDPRSVRYFADDITLPCADVECRDELEPIEEASEYLLYWSEGDYPLNTTYLPDYDFDTLEDKLSEVYGDLEVYDYDGFMAGLGREDPWMEDYQLEDAARYRELDGVMQDQLTDLRVYSAGHIEIHIFIVGLTSCGHIGGLRTISIET